MQFLFNMDKLKKALCFYNKNAKIHKSKSLKQLKCVSVNKIVSKFVVKLLKYRLMFMDILTILGLDYRDVTITELLRYLNRT